MKIKKRKKGKKLQELVSNVSAPALLLLPDKQNKKQEKKNKKLYSKFSLSALISVQTGFVWVLESPGILLRHFAGLENYWTLKIITSPGNLSK